MKLNLDLKTLVLIISTSCMLAGFYYTTESRLKAVELEILAVQQQTGKLKENELFYQKRVVSHSLTVLVKQKSSVP